jgi:hypothetical protein
MPKLVRFYIRHTLIGFAVAGGFVAMLLWFNVANLWHLVSTSDIGVMAVFLLVMFHGIVFSGVQFGIAIMRLAEDDDAGGTRLPEAQAELVPVAVRPSDRR